MNASVLNVALGQLYSLRFFVALCCIVALALAGAGMWALRKKSSEGNAYQYLVAVQCLRGITQFGLVLVLVRVCLVASCVVFTADVGLLLPVVLLAVALFTGLREGGAATLVKCLVAAVAQYGAWLVYAMLCGYVTATLAHPLLWVAVVLLAVLQLLLAATFALGDIRVLLESDPAGDSHLGAAHAAPKKRTKGKHERVSASDE